MVEDPRPAASRPTAGPTVEDDALILDLGTTHRCLSSAVLGGGMAEVRTWLNVQVPKDYSRTDPEAHLLEVAAERNLTGPVVGMLTAALVRDYAAAEYGSARALATVGVRDPVAAAGELPAWVARAGAGTINVLVVLDAPLTDTALAGAVVTATEAKAQALAAAGIRASNAPVPATGTATDSICVACPYPGDPREEVEFAGTATPVGNDLARAVHAAVLEGTGRYLDWRAANEPESCP